MRLIHIILIFTIFLTQSVFAQRNNSIKYIDFDDATEYPDTVKSITFNFSLDSIKSILKNLDRFKNLQSIRIVEMKKSDLAILDHLNKISSLKIESSEEISLNEIIYRIKNDSTINELILESNDLKQIPENFTKLTSLNKVVISNNEELNLEQAVGIFSKMTNIKYLGLPINQITDLPKNIGKLKQIEVLDISNNSLLTIPSGMKTMSKLDTLYTEGNVFISPENDLSKLKSLKIKYLSIDETTDNESLDKLYDYFPNSRIELKKGIEPIKREKTILSDSAVFENKFSKIDTANTIDYGVFKLEKSDIFVYSDAYSKYADFFEDDKNPSFDTLIFDQRFESLNYTNNVRRQPNTFGSLYLTRIKHNNHKISFYCNGLPRFIPLEYKELAVYSNVGWVYKGTLKRKQFKRKYLKRRFRTIYWRDVKILPNNDFSDYSIILKGNDKYDTITCYPYLTYKSDDETSSTINQKILLKKFIKYKNLRTKRTNNYNLKLLSQFGLYKATNEKAKNEKWLVFQKLYMSPIEQKMSYNEWMNYYDKIMQDEENAVKNAEISTGTTIRALEIGGYQKIAISEYINDSLPITSLSIHFSSDTKKVLSTKYITVIDKTARKYYKIDGTKCNKPNEIMFPKGDEICILVESLINEMAIVSSAEVNAKLDESKIVNLNSTILNSKIGTVSQIFNLLGL